MLKYWWSLLLVALVACGGGSTTAPTVLPPADQPVAVVQPVATTPQPVAAAPGNFWEGSILPNAGWSVKNTSTERQSFTAYYTDFDNQSLVRGSKVGVVAANDVFAGSFNTTCVQVDVTQGPAGSAPFLFGYINKAGKVVNTITAADRLACAPPCVPKYTYNGKLVLTADATSPSKGDSLFKYHVYKQMGKRDVIPGLGDDKQIWEDNMTKGEIEILPVPNDGAQYYAFYDGEIWYNEASTTATCSTKDLAANWHPKLRFECETINSCEQQKK